MARNTETGRRYRFDTIDGYYDYSSRVPVVEYEAIRDDVMRMVRTYLLDEPRYVATAGGAASEGVAETDVERR